MPNEEVKPAFLYEDDLDLDLEEETFIYECVVCSEEVTLTEHNAEFFHHDGDFYCNEKCYLQLI